MDRNIKRNRAAEREILGTDIRLIRGRVLTVRIAFDSTSFNCLVREDLCRRRFQEARVYGEQQGSGRGEPHGSKCDTEENENVLICKCLFAITKFALGIGRLRFQ